MLKAIKSAYDWLAGRPGYLLLTASAERLDREAPARFARAWVDLMLLSLAWGLASVGIWSLAWIVFRDYGDMLIMPALATASVLVLWPMRRAILALAEVLGGKDPMGRTLAVALLVVGLVLCFVRLKSAAVYYEQPLPATLAWIRPDYKLYRALLLMPLWGGWSMMVAGRFRRSDGRTEPAVAAFARGCGPLAAAACMGAVLAWSILYFRFLPWSQLSISAAAIVAAIGGGLAFCRAAGGLTRQALLANNVLTQVVFLLAYLGNGG